MLMLILNIVLSAVFFFFYWRILSVIAPEIKWPAVLTVLFNGQLILIYLGASDMGLFVTLLFALWFAVLYKKPILQAVLLFLVAIARPEGIIIVALFLLFSAKKVSRRLTVNNMIPVAAGLTGIGFIMMLNYSLTGMIAFDSGIGKNYFFRHDILTALSFFVKDILALFREILFLGRTGSREFYFPAVVAGVLIMWGLLRRFSRRDKEPIHVFVEYWWLGAVLLQFALVAWSGYQGIHTDRYFTWIFPILTIYLFDSVRDLFKSKNKIILFYSLIIGFQIMSFSVFINLYAESCARTQTRIDILTTALASVNEQTTIGTINNAGIKYVNESHNVVNMGGIAPYFRGMPFMVHRLKTAQYNPELQFEYLLDKNEKHLIPNLLFKSEKEIRVATIFDISSSLKKMNWQPLLRSSSPVFASRLNDSLTCIDSLDIGFVCDEERCDYSYQLDYDVHYARPFSMSFQRDSLEYLDVARPVLGQDRFHFRSYSDRDHWLVVRCFVPKFVQLQAFGKLIDIELDDYNSFSLQLASGFTGAVADTLGSIPGKMNEFLIHIPKTPLKIGTWLST
ncbi:MAG: hypothetical protein U5R06_04495 [candidate division KSB1 bacterium]|nr:hypothetical protein [candidate division KSB1 bacterium]